MQDEVEQQDQVDHDHDQPMAEVTEEHHDQPHHTQHTENGMNHSNQSNQSNAMDVDENTTNTQHIDNVQDHPQDLNQCPMIPDNVQDMDMQQEQGHGDGDGDGGMEVERTEQSNSVGPTVVNAFPTTMSTDDVPHGQQGGGGGEFEFGSIHGQHNGDGQGGSGGNVEDGDVDMDGGDGDVDNRGPDEAVYGGGGQGGDDVLGDIANAVESNVTNVVEQNGDNLVETQDSHESTEVAASSMPVLETSTTENEEAQNEAEQGRGADTEMAPQPAIIPTMPEMQQRDDNATDSVQSAVNNDDAETPQAGNGDGQTLTPQKAMTPQKVDDGHFEEKHLEHMDPAQGLNVMDAVQDEGMEHVGGGVDEDEDVDTPLADEIDF